ncbi:MAG: hypothetical protein DI537_47040 [Stutzerimonas stutzeri]|nr:MAG: hypothetical protein DI537_47040 [Stutzerimonas stutzeri]
MGSLSIGPTASIELQPVKHTAPARLGLLWALLRPILGRLVAVLRGRRAPRQFQALEPAAALLPIASPVLGEILARICTKILGEIRADFLRGSPIKGMIPGRRLPFCT